MNAPGAAADRHVPIAGMLWMLAATVFFSLSFTLVKGLQDAGLTVFQAILFRQLLGTTIVLPVMLGSDVATLKTAIPFQHAKRATLGFLGMCTGYYSLVLINVGDSVALQFTLPIFTMIAAVLILGEKILSHRLIATLIGFAGVLIIVRPGLAELNLGIMMALSSAAFHAVSDTYARYLSRYDKVPTIMGFNFLFTIPLAAIPAVIYWEPVSLDIWPLLLAFGMAGISAQYCLTRSFSLAEASLVSPILFFRLPIVAVISWYAFDQLTEIWTWVGAGVIAIATTWMARVEVRKG
jgi:drug/metabolite transporter (DMT)-like permease